MLLHAAPTAAAVSAGETNRHTVAHSTELAAISKSMKSCLEAEATAAGGADVGIGHLVSWAASLQRHQQQEGGCKKCELQHSTQHSRAQPLDHMETGAARKTQQAARNITSAFLSPAGIAVSSVVGGAVLT
jgi:hypothetical protein